MQRKRIAIAAIAVVATGAAVAFTLPSMAGTTGARDKAPQESAGSVTPQLLQAMMRDLNLTADEVAARVKRARWAGGVSSTLAAETGSDYGGAWLAADGSTLKIAVTDKKAAAKVTAAGGQAVTVKRSEQELDAAKERLDQAAAKSGDLIGWYVSVSTNKVVVQAEKGDDAAAWAFAKAAGLNRDAVAVETAERPKPLADVRGGDAYIVQIGGGAARCSVGFAVEGGFVTAGHCGPEGTPTADQQGGSAGVVEDSVFPGESDLGFVKTGQDAALQPFVNDFEGNLLPVRGSEETPVGGPVCRSGSTTGTFCGTILATNQTVQYPEGTVTGLTATDVCAEGGDSGGPWLTDDQAQGVTSGGSGDCGANRADAVTFFQPVNEILARNNLTLLVAEGGQGGQEEQGQGEEGQGEEGEGAEQPPAEEPPAEEPPAEEPPAEEPPAAEPPAEEGACPDLPVDREGAIDMEKHAQAQPDGGAFRARGGKQTACLQAPEGADFDLVLQRRTWRGNFRTVAKSTGDEAVKQLTFRGRSGTYRYVVVASSGTGSYTLGFSTP